VDERGRGIVTLFAGGEKECPTSFPSKGGERKRREARALEKTSIST